MIATHSQSLLQLSQLRLILGRSTGWQGEGSLGYQSLVSRHQQQRLPGESSWQRPSQKNQDHPISQPLAKPDPRFVVQPNAQPKLPRSQPYRPRKNKPRRRMSPQERLSPSRAELKVDLLSHKEALQLIKQSVPVPHDL